MSIFEKCQLECESPIGNMVMIMHSVPLNSELIFCMVKIEQRLELP